MKSIRRRKKTRNSSGWGLPRDSWDVGWYLSAQSILASFKFTEWSAISLTPCGLWLSSDSSLLSTRRFYYDSECWGRTYLIHSISFMRNSFRDEFRQHFLDKKSVPKIFWNKRLSRMSRCPRQIKVFFGTPNLKRCVLVSFKKTRVFGEGAAVNLCLARLRYQNTHVFYVFIYTLLFLARGVIETLIS